MQFIIFDIDGTLANTKKVDDKCFIKAFQRTFNIDITNQKWEDLQNVTDWGITEEIIQREKNETPKKEDYEQMITHFVAGLQKEKDRDLSQFIEVPGAKDFFHQLKGMKEYKLGVATGAWEKSALLKLNAIEIELSDVCFSNSNYHKSREAITLDVITQLTNKHQHKAARIIYFGDGEWDFKTCQKLGIEFIGIDVENDGKLKELGAQTVFEDYSNPTKMLEILNQN